MPILGCWTLLTFALLVVGVRLPVWAQSEGSDPESEPALLVIQNRPVFLFRTSLGPRSPQERMADARQRLEALAEMGGADSATIRPLPQGALVSVGGRGIFAITPGDVDSLAGESLAELSERARKNLELALSAEREQRNLSRFLWSVGLTLVATFLSSIVYLLIRASHRFLRAHLPELAIKKLPEVTIGGFRLLDADRLLTFLQRLIDGMAWAVGLFSAYLWLTYSLTRFPYSRPWGEALGDYLLSTLGRFFLGIVHAVPGLFTAFLILLFTRFLVRWATAFFSAVEKGEVDLPWLHADTANPTRRIATALLWLFAVILAYPWV